MTVDFDGIRAELACAITALQTAMDTLAGDYSNPATYARVDMGRTIADLKRGYDRLAQTEAVLKRTTNNE